jgi:acetoin utilization deacetylase AcuC-like enzyme
MTNIWNEWKFLIIIIVFKNYIFNYVYIKIKKALAEFRPDLIIYNAGTDILANNPLRKLHVSDEGIKIRDEIVFKTAKDRQIPIVMLTRFAYFHM